MAKLCLNNWTQWLQLCTFAWKDAPLCISQVIHVVWLYFINQNHLKIETILFPTWFWTPFLNSRYVSRSLEDWWGFTNIELFVLEFYLGLKNELFTRLKYFKKKAKQFWHKVINRINNGKFYPDDWPRGENIWFLLFRYFNPVNSSIFLYSF